MKKFVIKNKGKKSPNITEKEIVLQIKEKVNNDNSITTTLWLEVEYADQLDLPFNTRLRSDRTIEVDILKDGNKLPIKYYKAEGYVTADRLMDIHTENYLKNWKGDIKTKINFVGSL